MLSLAVPGWLANLGTPAAGARPAHPRAPASRPAARCQCPPVRLRATCRHWHCAAARLRSTPAFLAKHQSPGARFLPVAKTQAGVLQQLPGVLQRISPGQVSRAGHQPTLEAAELATHQFVIGRRVAQANRQVIAPVQQVIQRSLRSMSSSSAGCRARNGPRCGAMTRLPNSTGRHRRNTPTGSSPRSATLASASSSASKMPRARS